MKNLSLLVMFFLPIFCYCQPLTFNDTYLGTDVGKITVAGYKIVNGERVLHGSFSFSGTRNPSRTSNHPTDKTSGTVNITCALNEGEWDGPFKVIAKGGSFKGIRDVSISGFYKSGKIDGKWVFNIKMSDDVFGPYTVNHTLVFKENQLVEGILNTHEGVYESFKTDENGYIHGKNIMRYKEKGFSVEEICSYLHGVLIYSEKKDVGTKSILEKKYHVDTLVYNEKNYNTTTNSFVSSDGKEFKITPGKEIYKSVFDHKYELNDYLGISPWNRSVQKFIFAEKLPKLAKIVDVEAEKLAKAKAEQIEMEKKIEEEKQKKRIIATQKNTELYNQKSSIRSLYGLFNKKNLLKSYDEIFLDYEKLIQNEKDIDAIIQYLEKSFSLGEQMIKLKGADTKELEAKLKNASTIEEKLKLIME